MLKISKIFVCFSLLFTFSTFIHSDVYANESEYLESILLQEYDILNDSDVVLESKLTSLLALFWSSYIQNFSKDEGKSAEYYLDLGLKFIDESDFTIEHRYNILFLSTKYAFGKNDQVDLSKMIEMSKQLDSIIHYPNTTKRIKTILEFNPLLTLRRLNNEIAEKYAYANNFSLSKVYLEKAVQYDEYKDQQYYVTKSIICKQEEDIDCEIENLKKVIDINLNNLEKLNRSKSSSEIPETYQLIYNQNLYTFYIELSAIYFYKKIDDDLKFKYLNLAISHIFKMLDIQNSTVLISENDYFQNFFNNKSNLFNSLTYLFEVYLSQKPNLNELGIDVEYVGSNVQDKYFAYNEPFWATDRIAYFTKHTKPVARIENISDDSQLAKLGLKKDDYIISINNNDINSVLINDEIFYSYRKGIIESLLDDKKNKILKVSSEELLKPKKLEKISQIFPQEITLNISEEYEIEKFNAQVNYNIYNNAFKLTQLLLNTKANQSLIRLHQRRLSNIDPIIVKKQQDIKHEIEKIKKEILQNAWTSDRREEEDLKVVYDRLQENLLNINKEIGIKINNTSNQKIYELNDVMSMLLPNEALIINFEIDDSYFQWIIIDDGTVRINKVFPNQDFDYGDFYFISDGIKNYREAITDKINNKAGIDEVHISRVSAALHNLLILPNSFILSQKKNKIFLSYGDFAKLPPSSLEIPLTGYYNEIQSIPSSPTCKSDFDYDYSSLYCTGENTISNIASLVSLEMRSEKKSKKIDEMKYLGIGNPKFQENSLLGSLVQNSNLIDLAQTIFRDSLIADRDIIKSHLALPETENEIKTIASNFKKSNTKILLRHEASETNLKSMDLSQYDVISFATHSIPSYGDNEPGLVLSLPKKSSLNDDGVLTPGEIVNLDLNAKLVILSACNTANGKDNDSEILSGLAQAFLYAGAESIIVTHWPVETNSTVLLMTSFFDYWLKEKMDPAEALKHAKIDLRNIPEYNHPIYWAGFSYYGL